MSVLLYGKKFNHISFATLEKGAYRKIVTQNFRSPWLDGSNTHENILYYLILVLARVLSVKFISSRIGTRIIWNKVESNILSCTTPASVVQILQAGLRVDAGKERKLLKTFLTNRSENKILISCKILGRLIFTGTDTQTTL